MKQSEIVLVPAPGVGHLVSAVEFAKLVVERDDRISIVIFIINSPSGSKTHAYTQSIVSSSNFPNSIRFILLPPPSDSNQSMSYVHTLVESSIPQLKQAVYDLLRHSNSTSDSPRLAGFIVDMFCTAIIDVADEFNVPAVVFYTSGAAFLGFMLHVLVLKEQNHLDMTAYGFKDSGADVEIPSFANMVPASVFPSTIIQKEWTKFVHDYVTGLRKAKGFIINTFQEFEPHALHYLSESHFSVYPVGPILNNNNNDSREQSSDIIGWLDNQPQSSVIFLCFGSSGYFEEDQVREIARALENSELRFLWSLRKPPAKESGKSVSDYTVTELTEVLPEGFLDRTAGIGKVIGWAPQAQILAHQAVGGFVSHCGWNSILESVYYGVPVATWPLYAEQQTNAFELVCELKMAVEICLDYRTGEAAASLGSQTLVSAERINKGIKELMKPQSDIRKKVKQLSEQSKKALLEGGSSYSSFTRFIDDMLNVA